MNPIRIFMLAFAALASSLFAQDAPTVATDTAVSPPGTSEPPAELHDPFHGGGGDYEREARRKLAQTALNRCRILARGACSSGAAAVLLSLSEGRNSLLKVGDSLTLDADGELIDFEVVAVTRQVVRFALEDGSSLVLR